MVAGEHRVHGMGTGLEAPSWPAITAVEAAEALAHFPAAGGQARLEWHSPRPFSSATLARTSTGELFLKRHHRRLRDAQALAGEHAFIEHLGARGVPVAQVLTAHDGAGAVTIGDWTWEVHGKAPGLDLYRDRPSWTPFLDPGHARASGAMLARLHRAAEDFAAPSRPARPLVTSLSILPAADPLAAAQAYVAARPALADYCAALDWTGQLGRVLADHDAATLAPLLAQQPSLWTHNDWHPSNLLWTEHGTVASVLDFGLADRTCALHDLATALERCAVRWLELQPDAPLGEAVSIAEPETARALLAGYAQERPLTAGDRQLLARLLPLVHIEFALSEVDYFHGVLARRADADLAWHGYLIGHADWFKTPPGQALLGVVAGQ